MKYSELKEANHTLVQTVLHWMSVAARALARVEILQSKVTGLEKAVQDMMALARRRGDELQRLRGNEKHLLSSIRQTAYERNFREDLGQQIDKLANFIMAEIPGEPSRSEGAVEVAIRLLRKHVVIPSAKRAAMLKDPKWCPSAVRAAMNEINELIKTLPEKKFLREEPLQLVILRALRRMHSSMELHKSYDTTVGRLVEAEERIQSVVEMLSDALVGQPEFDNVEAPVEDRAAACIARLKDQLQSAASNYCTNAQELRRRLEQSVECYSQAHADRFTLTATVGKQAARIAVLEEQLAKEVAGRMESNSILQQALSIASVDTTKNPYFYANRAAQTIRVIRDDNTSLRHENQILKAVKVSGFPQNGTCVLEGHWTCRPVQEVHLTFSEGRLTGISVKPRP